MNNDKNYLIYSKLPTLKPSELLYLLQSAVEYGFVNGCQSCGQNEEIEDYLLDKILMMEQNADYPHFS